MKAQSFVPSFLLSKRRDLSIRWKNVAILIWNSSRRIYFYFLLILFDTTSRIMGGCTNQRLAPPSGNLTPPRISPSCPHCVILQPDGFQMLWTTLILSRAVAGQEYHYAPFRSWPRRVLPGFYRLPLLAHTGQDCMQDQL